MWRRISTCILLTLVTVCAVQATDPIDKEMFPLLEKVKSSNQVERQQAVRELLTLREAVNNGLKNIVIDANNGIAPSRSKAGSMFLMGELGLVQCKQLLDRERDWTWKPPGVHSLSDGDRLSLMLGKPAESALHRAAFAANLALLELREKGSLSRYPNLSQALSGLRSTEESLCRSAEDSLLRWYDVVCRSMHSVLKPSRKNVYPNEIKATAAYVMGEFRAPSRYGQMLLWNIDLEDEKAVCSQYYKTLAVQTSEPQYPCVVAMIKLGYRAEIRASLTRIQTKPQLSQETRNRIVRVLTKIDKTATKMQYEKIVSALEKVGKSSLSLEEKQERLQRLRSIESIVKE